MHKLICIVTRTLRMEKQEYPLFFKALRACPCTGRPSSQCKPHRRMYRAMAKVATHKLATTSNVIQMVHLPTPLWEEGGAAGRVFGSLVLSIAVHNKEEGQTYVGYSLLLPALHLSLEKMVHRVLYSAKHQRPITFKMEHLTIIISDNLIIITSGRNQLSLVVTTKRLCSRAEHR